MNELTLVVLEKVDLQRFVFVDLLRQVDLHTVEISDEVKVGTVAVLFISGPIIQQINLDVQEGNLNRGSFGDVKLVDEEDAFIVGI